LTLADLATIDAVRGNADRVTEHLTQLRQLASSSADLVHAAVGRAQGLLDLGAGRPATALEHLVAAIRVTRHDSSPIVVLGVPDAVEAAVRVQRVDAVAPHYARFSAWVERFPNAARLALLERCRAMLDEGDTERHYRAALDGPTVLNPFDHARTQLLYGEWLRRERRRLEARPPLRSAIAAFERFGAAPWAHRARNELRASGETTRRRDPSTRDELTPQELQIATLAASGLTNPEIAAQLFLSPRTVDYHLRKVFAKLDIASRNELAGIELDD
jgi:DNA-binding CsgD family transcriptional regulator